MTTVNINNYSVNGTQKLKLSRKTLQEIFGVSNREKWVERLEACGFTVDWFCQKLGISQEAYNPRTLSSIPIFEESEIVKLSLLDLFLHLKKGRFGFSKSQFRTLDENDYLPELKQQFNLDPIAHFREKFHAYNQRN